MSGQNGCHICCCQSPATDDVVWLETQGRASDTIKEDDIYVSLPIHPDERGDGLPQGNFVLSFSSSKTPVEAVDCADAVTGGETVECEELLQEEGIVGDEEAPLTAGSTAAVLPQEQSQQKTTSFRKQCTNEDAMRFKKTLTRQMRSHMMDDAIACDPSDPEERVKMAQAFRVAEGCSIVTDGTTNPPLYEYRSVFGTSSQVLGEYGVGVRLYFDHLKFLGILLTLLWILNMPMLIISGMGNLIEKHDSLKHVLMLYKAVAGMSLANLGYIGMEDIMRPSALGFERGDHFKHRPLTSSADGPKVSDATEALGTLDGISVLLFILAGVWFHQIYIPRTVKEQDALNDTPADYTLSVDRLPPRLEEKDHEDYQEILKKHFVQILLNAGIQNAESAIEEVVLCRDYGNQLAHYIEMGNNLQRQVDFYAKCKHQNDKGNNEAAEEAVLKAHACRDKLLHIADNINQALLKDYERDVVRAYISFKREAYKIVVLHDYRDSNSWLFRRFQPERLRFRGYRLQVLQAYEPSQIYYENLDVPRWTRRRRLCTTIVLAIFILLTTLMTAGYFTQVPISEQDFEGAPLYFLKLDEKRVSKGQKSGHGCPRICYATLKRQDKEEGCIAFTEYESVKLIDSKGDRLRFIHEPQNGNYDCIEFCNWSAIKFKEDLKICELNIWTTREDFNPSWLQIFACYDDDMPDGYAQNTSLMASFDPEKVCTLTGGGRMKQIDATRQDPKALAIMFDTECEAAYYDNLDMSVLNRIKTEVKDYRLSCYCRRYQNAHDDIPEVCNDWYGDIMQKQYFYYIGLCLVILLNQVLWIVLTLLTSYVKYDSLSDLAIMDMTLVFVAQFVNLGIVAIVASMKTHAMFSRIDLGLFDKIIGHGAHHDFTVRWYVLVGSAFVMNFLGNVLSCVILVPLNSLVINELYVYWFKNSAESMDALRELYVLPEFPLSPRLAATNMITFSMMMFAGGLPVLYPLGVLYCFLSYWLDKWSLLKLSCHPPAYDARVFDVSVSIFPLAGVIHILVTNLGMYHNELIPSDFSFLRGMFEGIVNMAMPVQEKIYDGWNKGDEETRELDWDEFMRARILDLSRKRSWFSTMVCFCITGYFILNLIWRVIIHSCLGRIFKKELGEWIALYIDESEKGDIELRPEQITAEGDILETPHPKKTNETNCRETSRTCMAIHNVQFLPQKVLQGAMTRHYHRQRHRLAKSNWKQAQQNQIKSHLMFSYDFKLSKKYKGAFLGLQYAQNELTQDHVERFIDHHETNRSHGYSPEHVAEGLLDLVHKKHPHLKQRSSLGDTGAMVLIISGHELTKTDVIGHADPFCRCGVVNKPTAVFQTNVVKNTCNPVWNYEHRVTKFLRGDDFRFIVFDKDVIGQQEIGRAFLKYDELMAKVVEGIFEGDIHLTTPKAKDSNERMRIRVKITLIDATEVAVLDIRSI